MAGANILESTRYYPDEGSWCGWRATFADGTTSATTEADTLTLCRRADPNRAQVVALADVYDA